MVENGRRCAGRSRKLDGWDEDWTCRWVCLQVRAALVASARRLSVRVVKCSVCRWPSVSPTTSRWDVTTTARPASGRRPTRHHCSPANLLCDIGKHDIAAYLSVSRCHAQDTVARGGVVQPGSSRPTRVESCIHWPDYCMHPSARI